MENIFIFKEGACKTKSYPGVGVAKVYLKHDENLGKCLLSDGFITPNMPKLQYAVNFQAREESLEILDSLNPELSQFEEAWVFEKRDGFNLLFYRYCDKVIPKTRTAPIASGKIQEVITLPEFPMEAITAMVHDGFVPVFEVWGTKLEEFNIVHGGVNVQEVQKAEGLLPLNVDLIAVMRQKPPHYPYVSAQEMLSLAQKYGLRACKFWGIKKVSVETVKKLMLAAEQRNKEAGTVVTEGFVLHCGNGLTYKMFKVKPYQVMKSDVMKVKRTIPTERIELEVGKVLLETDIRAVAKDPLEYLNEVLLYLEEDYTLTHEIKKKISLVFSKTVAKELIKKIPAISPEIAGRSGIHKMIIGALVNLQKEK